MAVLRQEIASQLLMKANIHEQEVVSYSPNAAACWVTDKVCVASSAACDGVAKVSSVRVHAGADRTNAWPIIKQNIYCSDVCRVLYLDLQRLPAPANPPTAEG